MCKWKQGLKELINKNRQHKEKVSMGLRESLNSFCGKQYHEDVVIPAFREIEKVFKDNGNYVWIHWEANSAWLTIGHADMASGENKYTKEVKYKVEISGPTMKSRLYQMMNFGPQKEYPIGDEHEITGDAKGKNIADITSKDIIDDFMAAYEGYVNNEM